MILTALALAAAAPDTLPGELVGGVYRAEAATLPYRLYLPANPAAARGASLVVMLHGCTQTPEDFAAGTRMNELAEELGFLVLYPEQTVAANPLRCWNWYDPAHQARGAGEPALLDALARQVARERAADGERIFVAGVSAGGAMALTLAARYPEAFAAVGIHSGIPLGAAASVAEGLRVMRDGADADLSRGRLAAALDGKGGEMRAILFHGAADAVVNPSNAHALREQWLELSGGMPGARTRTDTTAVNGLRVERWILEDAAGLSRIESWLVDGLGHAWSGGSKAGSYADPRGPDASREMIRFFLARGG